MGLICLSLFKNHITGCSLPETMVLFPKILIFDTMKTEGPKKTQEFEVVSLYKNINAISLSLTHFQHLCHSCFRHSLAFYVKTGFFNNASFLLSLHILRTLYSTKNCRLGSAMPSNLSQPIPHSLLDPSLSLPTPLTSHHDTRKRGGGRGRSRKQNIKNSDLTEGSLEKFNRANERKVTSCSPYYNGFPDKTLYLARQKLTAPTSPGKDSHGTTATSSSISTVFVRIQEWSTSCFKGKNDSKDSVAATMQKAKIDSFSSVNTIVIREAVELRKKEFVSAKIAAENSTYEEKPLRERVSTTTVAATATSAAAAETLVVKQPPILESIVSKEKFVWANKYRPKALEHFICNQDKAKELMSMVRIPCRTLHVFYLILSIF